MLTLPAAIWNERMKAMMRRACTIAEVVGDPSWCKEGIHFTFALEPEAAAISFFEPNSGVVLAPGAHASRLPCSAHSSDTNAPADRAFMVVDAGGGTIDITGAPLVRWRGGSFNLHAWLVQCSRRPRTCLCSFTNPVVARLVFCAQGCPRAPDASASPRLAAILSTSAFGSGCTEFASPIWCA